MGIPSRTSWRRADPWIVVGLAACAVLFWKLRIFDPAVPGTFEPTRGQGDLFTYSYPMAVATSRSLLSGQVPLWNPYQGMGQPLLASVAGGSLYPLGISTLILPVALAMEITIALHLALAAVLTFLCARTLGLGRSGSVAAAVVYASSSFVTTQALWFPPALASCVWLPLGLLALARVVSGQGRLWAVVLALATAMPILAGWLQTWVYTMYALALYAGLALLARARSGVPIGEVSRRGLWVAGGVALGVLLAAVQLLPSYELRSLSRVAEGLSYEEMVPIPVSPAQLLSVAVDPNPKYPELFYVGIVPLLAVPFSLFSPIARQSVLFFWLLLVSSLGLVVGMNTSLFDLFMQLPALSWFRHPQRLAFLAAFASAMLTGITIHWLVSARRRSTGRFAAGIALATGLAGAVTAAAPISPTALVLLWLGLLLLASASWVPFVRMRNVCLAALIALLAWDGFHATRNTLKHPYHAPEALEFGRRTFDFIRKHQGFDRTYIHAAPLDFALMPKRGILESIHEVRDYEPLGLNRRSQVFALVMGRAPGINSGARMGFLGADPAKPGFRLLDMMSVRYAVVRESDPAFASKLRSLPNPWRRVSGNRGSELFVFENASPLPRAYVASNVIEAESADEALQILASPDFDPHRSVVIEGPIDAPPSGADPPGIAKARIRGYHAVAIDIETDAPHDGVLVLTDSFYPGWEVRVDGEPAETLPANYLFRGVPIRAGPHRVTFRYQPKSFLVGAWVSAVTTLGVCLVALWNSARRQDLGRARRRKGALRGRHRRLRVPESG